MSMSWEDVKVPIPRLINFVWIDDDDPLPTWAQRVVEEFARLNPDYEVRLHGPDALLPEYSRAWEASRYPTQRADLLRYSVLERYGGWYFDLDFWPFRPLAEAEQAWGLDGARLAIARQNGHRSGPRAAFANAPLACAPDLEIWEDVKAEIRRRIPPPQRTSYGSEVITALRERFPSRFVVMDWPWWFPSPIANAADDFAAIERDIGWARLMCRETGGQLPFAMHLWAGGRRELPKGQPLDPNTALILADENGPEFTKYAAPCDRWPKGHPLAAAREGLEAAGFTVKCLSPFQVGRGPRYCGAGLPAVAIVWNGRRTPAREVVERLKADGVLCFHLEHGFWRRREFVQCDHAGFLHFASWADWWGNPVPVDAHCRLGLTAPVERAPMRVRTEGPILVIGQVGGDTQLDGAEVRGPAELDRLVARALPKGALAVFRPHPLDAPRDARARKLGRTYLPRAPEGQDLIEALDSARFVVTINSNSLVEAAFRGCPALAFGPSTAINAGVARRATVATLRDDLEIMLAGWAPPQDAVDRYLLWLACRQYEVDDLRLPGFWRKRVGNG